MPLLCLAKRKFKNRLTGIKKNCIAFPQKSAADNVLLRYVKQQKKILE